MNDVQRRENDALLAEYQTIHLELLSIAARVSKMRAPDGWGEASIEKAIYHIEDAAWLLAM